MSPIAWPRQLKPLKFRDVQKAGQGGKLYGGKNGFLYVENTIPKFCAAGLLQQ